jgi:hypothetical protein
MQKPPLFRRVNTTAHGVHHRFGGDFSDERNVKASLTSETTHLSMRGKVRRGLDYTPLYRFLLSKVGYNWNEIHAEAVSRLDRPEPIFWLVALRAHEEQAYVRTGEASYFSGLRVDEEDNLQIVDPSVGPQSLVPWCGCCTHTFNGVRFIQKFNAELAPRSSGYRVA